MFTTQQVKETEDLFFRQMKMLSQQAYCRKKVWMRRCETWEQNLTTIMR